MFSSVFSPVALANLIHDRTRFLIGILGVAFSVLLVFLNLGFLGALSETSGLLYNQLDADVYLVSPQSLIGTSTQPFKRERLYQAAGQADVLKTSPLYSGYLPWRNRETHQEFFILGFGFNPKDRPFLLPEVQSQVGVKKLLEDNVVFFDRRSLQKYGPPEVGVKTEFNQRQVQINGVYALGGGMATQGTLMMSDQNFLRYYSPRTLETVDLGLIKLKPGADAEAVVTQLRKDLPRDVTAYTKAQMIERDRQYWLKTTAVGFIFSLGVGVALIVGAAIIYQILYADIAKNFREYATLKAVGFRNCFLVNVILQKAVLLAILGFIPGLILAWGAYDGIVKASNESIPMVLPMDRIGLVFVLAVGTCSLAAILSLRKILVADPASIL